VAKIENTRVYGLDEVFKTAKYPFAVDVNSVSSELTDGIKKCMAAPIGSGHDNALKGIVVMADWTLSNKAWIEAERYHFLDIVSSQSTMHKIAQMAIWTACNEYVTGAVKTSIEMLKDEYEKDPSPESYLRLLYNIPAGIEMTAGIVTNYQQLKTIYHQRRTHMLPDWHVVCDWIESLPYAELITGEK